MKILLKRFQTFCIFCVLSSLDKMTWSLSLFRICFLKASGQLSISMFWWILCLRGLGSLMKILFVRSKVKKWININAISHWNLNPKSVWNWSEKTLKFWDIFYKKDCFEEVNGVWHVSLPLTKSTVVDKNFQSDWLSLYDLEFQDLFSWDESQGDCIWILGSSSFVFSSHFEWDS